MLLEAPPMLPVSLLQVCSCFSLAICELGMQGKGGRVSWTRLGCRLTSHLASRCAWLSQQSAHLLLWAAWWGGVRSWSWLIDLGKEFFVPSPNAQLTRCFASWGNGGLSSWSRMVSPNKGLELGWIGKVWSVWGEGLARITLGWFL